MTPAQGGGATVPVPASNHAPASAPIRSERKVRKRKVRKRKVRGDAINWIADLVKTGKNPTFIYYNAPSVSLNSGEKLLGAFPNTTLQQQRAVRTPSGGYGGPSIRLVKGELRVIDRGTLVITNQRLIFIGLERTISVALEKIIDVEAYSDALALHREGKKKLSSLNSATI